MKYPRLKSFRPVFAAVVLTNIFVLPANASVFVSELDAKGRFAHLAITGEITKSDASKFAGLVANLRPRFAVVDVNLNSRGGDVVAAMQIGRLIRASSVWTIAASDPDTRCASACVLVLAAGVVRIADDDSVVEIHRPYFSQESFAKLDLASAQRHYSELAKSVQAYLSQMGMSENLFQEMLKIPSDQGRRLSFDEMQQIGLQGWDPAYQEWLKAKSRH